jgi:diguanylate cyclase (GGDEF)-like protein
MRERSMIDPLTGCLLRPEGIRRLDAELRRAQRFGRPVALLLVDLDLFKSVNDRFGHQCGDAVLSAVGGLMTRTLRASDLRCRWGGEEFLIVLPESPLDNARRVAESLRARIAELGVGCSGETATTTTSIGVVIARPGDLDAQRLVSLADKALYQAKQAGRNCVMVLQGDSRVLSDEEAESPRAAALRAGAECADRSDWPDIDRRNPLRRDRRMVPSPGRRRTDPGILSGPWPRSS